MKGDSDVAYPFQSVSKGRCVTSTFFVTITSVFDVFKMLTTTDVRKRL